MRRDDDTVDILERDVLLALEGVDEDLAYDEALLRRRTRSRPSS